LQTENERLTERLERYKDEKEMYNRQIKDTTDREKQDKDQITDNKRRIKEFREILNR